MSTKITSFEIFTSHLLWGCFLYILVKERSCNSPFCSYLFFFFKSTVECDLLWLRLTRVLCVTRLLDLKQQMNFLCHLIPSEFTFCFLILKDPFSLPVLCCCSCCCDGDLSIGWELLGLCSTAGGTFGKLSQAFILLRWMHQNSPELMVDGIFSSNLESWEDQGEPSCCRTAHQLHAAFLTWSMPVWRAERAEVPEQTACNSAIEKREEVSSGDCRFVVGLLLVLRQSWDTQSFFTLPSTRLRWRLSVLCGL